MNHGKFLCCMFLLAIWGGGGVDPAQNLEEHTKSGYVCSYN